MLGDGQRLFIDAMAAALTENGVTVLAVATSPAEVLAAVGRHRPDICLLATRFNGHDNVGLLDLTGRRYPQVKIVMLADNADRPHSPVLPQRGQAAGRRAGVAAPRTASHDGNEFRKLERIEPIQI